MAKRGRVTGAKKKTEVVTVRLDPKLKYLAELAARKQRRPLSGFIEWAVEQSLSQVLLAEDIRGGGVSVAEAERKHQLWDLDEPDRVVRLAVSFPHLLTHDEQVLWKIIQEWTTKRSDVHVRLTADPRFLDCVREHWSTVRSVAAGARPLTDLPIWEVPPPRQVKQTF